MTEQVAIRGSIRRRLTLQLVGSAALLAVILFLLVQNFARQVAEESQDSILIASATSILDSASVQSGEILVDIPYAALSMLGNVSDDRVFYRVLSDDKLLTGYGDLPDVAGQIEPSSKHLITAQYQGDSIRMVSDSRYLASENHRVLITVSVAQTRRGQLETLARISRTAAVFGVGFFVVAAVLALLAGQSSIRPLMNLSGAVSRRGPKDLRPVSSPVPREMVPLVSSLNGFIERLRHSLTRSEDFIAEAAHRIRTPLATVRAQAEIALRRVERPENRQSLKEMIRAIDESSRAAGQLLDHAMVTFRTDHLETQELDFNALVKDIVERLQPLASMKDIDLKFVPSTAATVFGDEILIQSALRNILDNAIKYSPAETVVEIALSKHNKGTELTISDAGYGFPDGETDQLTTRFVRGENVASTVGSGLGLTIAKEVVEAHGGTIHLSNKQEGSGACISLIFPH